MYQIYLVIKENMDEEQSSMLISGHESLAEAAEQCLIDFARLNDANELSLKVDNLLLELQKSSEDFPLLSQAFLNILENYLT